MFEQARITLLNAREMTQQHLFERLTGIKAHEGRDVADAFRRPGQAVGLFVVHHLQAVFEEFYTFDLDHLKKENLGKAISKFQKMPAMTPFVLNYTIQHGLGGHAIPIDYSAMVIMLNTGIATQAEAKSGKVPGLERAIPKNKGIEFSGLLHEAAVALNNVRLIEQNRQLIQVLDHSNKALEQENRQLRDKIEGQYRFASIVGTAKSTPPRSRVVPTNAAGVVHAFQAGTVRIR